MMTSRGKGIYFILKKLRTVGALGILALMIVWIGGVARAGQSAASANGAKPIAANALVEEGSLEGANEDSVHGTMQLVLVQRQAEMMQKALSVFNNDFDKTASEDLPRVT